MCKATLYWFFCFQQEVIVISSSSESGSSLPAKSPPKKLPWKQEECSSICQKWWVDSSVPGRPELYQSSHWPASIQIWKYILPSSVGTYSTYMASIYTGWSCDSSQCWRMLVRFTQAVALWELWHYLVTAMYCTAEVQLTFTYALQSFFSFCLCCNL